MRARARPQGGGESKHPNKPDPDPGRHADTTGTSHKNTRYTRSKVLIPGKRAPSAASQPTHDRSTGPGPQCCHAPSVRSPRPAAKSCAESSAEFYHSFENLILDRFHDMILEVCAKGELPEGLADNRPTGPVGYDDPSRWVDPNAAARCQTPDTSGLDWRWCRWSRPSRRQGPPPPSSGGDGIDKSPNWEVRPSFYWEEGNVCVAVGRRNPPRL
eukprot:scaffold27989_cov94-Isochrysis_galbana.AAC.2